MRGVENNKKEFLRYTGHKRQANESEPPLTIEKGEQVSSDMEKAEVLNKTFTWVFTASQASHIFEIHHIYKELQIYTEF